MRRRGRASGSACAESFAARVVAWQRAHGRRDLPWQNTRDAYRIWLSEVMLQQTQVATVLPYFARFVDAFPSVEALASASLDRVLGMWSGLGYYRRAHHLHAAARAVVAHHAGRFPVDSATLATLPGVGRCDCRVRKRRARRDTRRQRQARARPSPRHRRLVGSAARAGGAVARGGGAVAVR